MYYFIQGTDKPGSLETRLAVRPAHLERIQTLQDEGRLLVAGPCPNVDSEDPGPAGFSGSVIIAEFDNLEQAETWANEDPYSLNGVYANVVVKPFKKVFP